MGMKELEASTTKITLEALRFAKSYINPSSLQIPQSSDATYLAPLEALRVSLPGDFRGQVGTLLIGVLGGSHNIGPLARVGATPPNLGFT